MQSGKGAPSEFISMKLCEKFHWTIQELNSQPWEQIDLFLDMMNIENEYQNKKQRVAENKAKKRIPG